MSEQPFSVLVHTYPAGRSGTGYLYELSGAVDSAPARNALLFIGGLGDGPQTVGYVRVVSSHLRAAAELGYSVFETRLSSAFGGFGYGNLARDVKEISSAVARLRALGREKIVLMGSSTGCQDCMEYNDPKYNATPVDGFILQGPVSDREAFATLLAPEELTKSLAHAEALIKEGKGEEIMPRALVASDFKTPISAYRWHSLISVGGDDDYFSSDLPDETLASIWGRVSKPVLIVPSGEDQFTPAHVDVPAKVERWKGFCRPGLVSEHSGMIPGANHEVEQDEAREWLGKTVVKFLREVERG